MTYIELYICGLMNVETITKKVKNRNRPTDLSDEVIAYRFFERDEVVINNCLIAGENRNYSPMNYLGQEFSLNDLKNCPNTAALQEKMKANNWKKVICTKLGRLQPINDEDMIVNF